MASEWETARLGDHVTHQKGFAFKSAEYRPSGHPIVRVSNFTDRSINMAECSYLDHDTVHQYEAYKLKYRDAVVATVGSWPTNPASVVGKTICVPEKAEGALLNQNAVRLRTKSDFDQRYLFYLLKQPDFQTYIVGTAQGSASQASITLKDIFGFEFKRPPLAEQKAIALVLGALDDKIELNRRMNATLEAMARTLFRSWFVDFDPVRRNLDRAGKKSTDLSSQALAEEDAFFPDSFEDSSLGLIPKGWRRAALGDPELFPLVAPGGLPESVGCMKYIATGDVSLDHISSEVPGDLKTLPSRANMRPGLGRIWFAKMKDSPKFLWTMAEDDQWWSSRVLSTGFAGIQATSADYEALLYCFVLSPEFDEAKNGFATGTTMQAVNNETIARISLVVPPPALARRFSDIVRPLFRRRWSNYREARSLATLRDTLLPKLLSGELSVDKIKEGLVA